jgi:quercetin dioxygenase-like cupin family protein
MEPKGMLKGSLGPSGTPQPGTIEKQSVTVDGVTATRVTFAPGARWSTLLAAKAGTPSCLAPHVALVVEGVLRVRMDDGAEEDFGPNDLMLLPPGHDAWTLGDEPCVFVEFSRGYDDYARGAGATSSTARLG